ncbi:hypothetical protein FT663_03707 [Candidozyma haemuli var. vulneris]|uniref:Cysteine protease RIM13 n=1 Tax=Candidozyma haemuli TaxID=45357 RepID=A0A2V1ARC2_9ASCO|nr:hypothetical protein CXQ85_004284 [[Candida] haemuloni]KAF3987708.1 hypothetical protein FT662_03843 [[Candida] haemuloni var. vulneris]KAF3989247.1 hypothetical protein FT663_03707 [[Candida] haemuloni var. vulneris]PVH20777.1 hypothetical protein CXQ85_004284 [[Candida] haemuloni]
MSSDEVVDIISYLQDSHEYLAEGKASEARVTCMKAAVKANKLLEVSDQGSIHVAKALASFTLQWFEKLKKDGQKALTMAEKLMWLSCEIYDVDWTPVLDFGGGLRSIDFSPTDCYQKELEFPSIGFSYGATFKSPEMTSGLEGFGDLCQDLLPNCSFVSSLLSIHDMGLGEKLERLVKYNQELGVAKVKLYINGCERELNIDTELPFMQPPHQDRYMMVRSSTNSSLYWPAILEKAYLIASGDDYNFSGSNMAQDTYMLLGWAPEVRKISKLSIDSLAELWDLKKRGLVALGLGTGPMSDSLASQLKVVPGHDYVVCGYSKDGVTLKNPWVSESRDRLLEVDASVFGHFTYLYLNWNMDALYKHSFSTSVISAPPKSSTLLLDRPQFVLENSSSETQSVGIVVEQFLVKTEPLSPYSVSVYENTRGKVIYPSQYVRAAGGKMTKSRVYFLKFDISPNSKYTLVIAGTETKTIFSVKLWSHSPTVSLYKAKPQYANVVEIEDSWTAGVDNGGNWALESYIDNPQWDLDIKQRLPKMFIAVSSSETADVNFHLLHTDKSQHMVKLRNFDKSKLLFCDNYSPGIHHHEVHDVEPGQLRLVVSNYDASVSGKFHLIVMYDGGKNNVELEKVPKALGLYNETVKFNWDQRNRYKLVIRSTVPNTKVTFKLQAGEKPQTLSSYRPAVRGSLFDSATQQPVSVNDKWNDSVYGVFVDCTLAKAHHDYILLVERFETGDGVCRVTSGSSSKLTITGEDKQV